MRLVLTIMNMPSALAGQGQALGAIARLIKIIVLFWRGIVPHPSYNQIARILEVKMKGMHTIGKMEAISV